MFRSLVDFVDDVLRGKGYQKKGNSFYILENSNYGVVNFQKSRSSNLGNTRFTINVGISSGKLRGYVDEKDILMKPKVEECHWKTRVGFLMPQNDDYWWCLDNDMPFDLYKTDIENTINTYVHPAIESHIQDKCLMKHWLSGASDGITEFQKYAFLIALLKLYNDEQLAFVVDEFLIYARKKNDEKFAVKTINDIMNRR